ncbi:MAG: polymer-forming cytoskeletal protein [Myxococcales bacterium]|nr:polymer-forming cytoskeletal protein [Myxococcales bacterium]
MSSKRRRDESAGSAAAQPESDRRRRGSPATLGSSIQIRGEVTGDEDLLIEGRVEGRVELRQGELTVGLGGTVSAAISARTVTIQGQLEGDVLGSERVEIARTGRLQGDIVCGTIVVHEGAEIHGSISTKPASVREADDS